MFAMLLTSSSIHRREKFMDMGNTSSFGSGGMICGLDMNMLLSFIHYLKHCCHWNNAITETMPSLEHCCVLYLYHHFFQQTVILENS